jgi:hypothetical protein
VRLIMDEKKRWSGLEIRNSTPEIRKKSERPNRALPNEVHDEVHNEGRWKREAF